MARSKKAKLLERLEEIAKDPDTEGAHVEADRALVDYIGDVASDKA